MSAARTAAQARSSWLGPLYVLTAGLLALTGFGQMPIYQRYYISDLPAMGWLADFYVTRNVHYAAAALLLALVAYAALDWLLRRRRVRRLTASGALRALLLAAIVGSGALIVVKNFPHVHFADGFVIALNLTHLAAVMALLMTSLVCRLKKKRWTHGV